MRGPATGPGPAAGRRGRGDLRLLAVLVALPLAALVAREEWLRATPYPAAALSAEFPGSIRLLDREGELLREVVNGDGARARWTPLSGLSPLVVEATIAVEDARFHEHGGVDLPAVGRAVVQAVVARRIVSGASTLTMQLARLLVPHRRDLRGKLGEMADAWRLERAATKAQLLEQYLNRAPYGAGTIGVEAASQRYLGKPSTHLSLAEAALIAGLPQGPTGLNPLRHQRAALARRATVLRRLEETGRIDAEARRRALAEPLALALVEAPPAPAALHFTDWVLSRKPAAGEVATTLDRPLQDEVEALLAAHVRALSAGGATNAAVVVLDNERCEVRALAGSADYWAPRGGTVNGALARRQPGSALKPFTYALAFEHGRTPASVVADVETAYGDSGGRLFVPRNFTEGFSGPVLMGEALARSLNVPAIRVANLLGPNELLDRLHLLGFDSLEKSAAHYGLGLTLGNGEVTLLELAQGYATLARGGRGCTARSLASAAAEPERRVFSEEVSYLVTDVLSDEALRIRAFGPATSLLLGFPVAVKTGTSENFRDSWAIGYTRRFTVAVWTGDFEGRSMNHLAGAAGAGPLFHQVMKRAVARGGERPERLEPPSGVVELEVCALSGARPGPHCPSRRSVRVPAALGPEQECPFHRHLAVDRRNGLLAGDHCPARFVERRLFELLPPVYASFQAEHGGGPPTAFSPLCPASGVPAGAVVITYPRAAEVFLVEPGYDRRTQSLELRAEVDGAHGEVTWLVDGARVAAGGFPYRASWQLEAGRHSLVAVTGGKRSDPVSFEVR